MRDRGGTFAPISPPEAGYPYPSVKHGPSWTKVRLSNPWLEPHHYTAAIDWMLDVVDGIEEGAFACRERVVGFSANYLLRYLAVRAVNPLHLMHLAHTCLTVATKFHERVFVPLPQAENLAIPLPRNSLTLELELLNTLGWELCGANPFTLAPDRLEQLFACDGVLPPTTEEQRARARFQLPLRLYMVVRGREYLEAPDPLAAAAAALDLTLRGALNLDAAAGAGLLPRVCALIDADPDAALDLRTALGAATLLARRGLTARHGG